MLVHFFTLGVTNAGNFASALQSVEALEQVPLDECTKLWVAFQRDDEGALASAITHFAKESGRGEHVVGEMLSGKARCIFTGNHRVVFTKYFGKPEIKMSLASEDGNWLDAIARKLQQRFAPETEIMYGSRHIMQLADLCSHLSTQAAAA